MLANNAIVHRDKTAEILRMRSDRDKIYLLVKSGYEIELHSFRIKSNKAIELVGMARDLQDCN